MIHAIITFMALATAPTQQSSDFAAVGEWAITRDALGCAAEKTEHQGRLPTLIRLFRFRDDRRSIQLQNEGWSVKDDEPIPLYILIDKTAFQVTGRGGSDHSIFITSTDAIFRQFASASYVTFFLSHSDDKETPLEQFKLSGSGVAIEQMNRCVASVVKEQHRATAREAQVPSDPFAKPTG